MFKRVFILTIFFFISNVSNAGLILQATNATSTETQFGDPLNVINQSGLSLNYVSLVDDFDAYIGSGVTHDSSSSLNRWTSDALPSSIDFALGNTYSIESLAFWNLGVGIGSIRQFDLIASNDPTFSSFIAIGTFNAIANNNPSAVRAQVFEFAPVEVSYIRLTGITSNGLANGGSIGEIAFEVSQVPIPAAIWLFSAGIFSLYSYRKVTDRLC